MTEVGTIFQINKRRGGNKSPPLDIFEVNWTFLKQFSLRWV